MKPCTTVRVLVCCWFFLVASASTQGAISYISGSRSIFASAPLGGVPLSASTNGFEDFDARVTSMPLPPLADFDASASQRSRLLTDRMEVECTAFVDGEILGSKPRYESASLLTVVFQLDAPSWATLYSGPIFRGSGRANAGLSLVRDATEVFSLTSSSAPLGALLVPGVYRLGVLVEANNLGFGGSGLSEVVFSLVIPTPQASALAIIAGAYCARRRR